MTPDDIRKLADMYGTDPFGSVQLCFLLRACADVVEVGSDYLENNKAGLYERHVAFRKALARLAEIKP